MQLNFYAPIALFCFNRPDHLQRTLDALSANEGASESHITFFCDGSRNEEEKALTDAVREIAHTVHGFASVTVIEREKNMGCAASIIDGLKTMFAKHEKLIVMEDDILCSPYTLQFLNEGLVRYKENDKVFSVAAWTPPSILESIPSEYPYDTYAIPRASCWGWASWCNRFENLDWEVSDYQDFKNSPEMQKTYSIGGDDMIPILDAQMEGKLDTWDIQVDYARFKKGQITIHPVISYTTNIGMGSGTHCTRYTDKYDNDITKALRINDIRWTDNTVISEKILNIWQKFYSYKQPFSIKNFTCNILKKIKLFNITRKLYRLTKAKLSCN